MITLQRPLTSSPPSTALDLRPSDVPESLPTGWGEDPSKIEAVIRDDPEALAAFREAMKHQGERTDFVDNVNEVERSPVGTSRAYSISRVKQK